jgi:hypothetical protein
MRKLVQLLAVPLGLVLALGLSGPAAAQQEPLVLSATTPLPDVAGGDFDHFAVDLEHDRLFVSAEVNGTIEVFRLSSGAHLLSMKDVAKSPHKLIFLPGKNELFVADAGDASCKIVDATDYHIIKRIPLAPQPDSGVYDPASRIFYVGNGGHGSQSQTSYISMISVDSGEVIGRISVPADTLKAMVIDEKNHKLFVNMRDKRQIGVVDLQRKTLAAVWPVPGPSRNSAMAYDPDHHRLFIGSRNPGKLLVLDSRNGTVIDTLNIVETSDEITFDKAHHRLYITGSSGLDVVAQEGADRYAVVQHVDTLGGKTSVYVPSLQQFYVVHTKGDQASEAGLQVFKVR